MSPSSRGTARFIARYAAQVVSLVLTSTMTSSAIGSHTDSPLACQPHPAPITLVVGMGNVTMTTQ